MKKKNILKISLISLPLLSLLTSCNIEDFLSIGEEIPEKIFPNVWAFLVQFIAFIIMIILIIVFGYKPIKAFIKKRQEMLDNEVKETLKKNEEASQNLADSKKEIVELKAKASNIIDNAINEGNEKKDEIIKKANEEADEIIKDAHLSIELDKEKASKEIKDELGDVALSLSSEILKREVKKEDNDRLIDDFINDLKEDN